VLAVAALALTGCGSSDSSSTATPSSSTTASSSPDPTDTATATPTPSRTPDLPTLRVEAADMHVAVLGRSAARTPTEKAVVQAWMTYWQGAADTYYLYRPTPRFTSVARGIARDSVVARMKAVRAKKQRIVGWALDNVTRVEVTGDTATVGDCTKNFTFTVNDEAEPVTRPDPYYLVTGTLQRSDGHWTVVRQHSDVRLSDCRS
jgi:hypothetical protein